MIDRGGLTGLPVELAEAFTGKDEVWEQWARQSYELRQMYTRWVAEPRRGRTRRKRARFTADYASRGVLLRSVQPRRDRSISHEIVAGVLTWAAIVLVLGTGELLIGKALDGRYAWMDLQDAASLSAALVFGPAVRSVWRHGRAPIATGS